MNMMTYQVKWLVLVDAMKGPREESQVPRLLVVAWLGPVELCNVPEKPQLPPLHLQMISEVVEVVAHHKGHNQGGQLVLLGLAFLGGG